MKTLVIIPAYNEEASIAKTVKNVIAAGFDYVVINDGSTDSTLQVCLDNNFNVLDLPINLGIGGAVQAGHKYALKNGYDVDIQFDGDGQHDASYLSLLIEEVEGGSNLVIGSRFLEKTDGFQSTGLRRAGINWLSGLIKVLTGTKVTDPTSGFRACEKKAIELFAQNYPTDYPEPESITTALKYKMQVTEVPVIMHERQGGKSSINVLKGGYYMIKVTLAIIINMMRRPWRA